MRRPGGGCSTRARCRLRDTNQNGKSVFRCRSTSESLGLATVEPTGIWPDFPAAGPRCRVDQVSDKWERRAPFQRCDGPPC